MLVGHTTMPHAHKWAYLSPLPVLNRTTVSSSPIQPWRHKHWSATNVAAPSGQTNIPWVRPIRFAASIIS